MKHFILTLNKYIKHNDGRKSWKRDDLKLKQACLLYSIFYRNLRLKSRYLSNRQAEDLSQHWRSPPAHV